MSNLSKDSIESYLEKLGAATPSPGGGSAAALVASTAASLLAMVAEINRERELKKFQKKAEELKKQELNSEEKEEAAILINDAQKLIDQHIALSIERRKLLSERRDIFSQFIDTDAKAYDLIKTLSVTQKESVAYQNALKNGVQVPLDMCKWILAILESANEEMDRTSKWLLSDLLEAVILSKAAFKSAKLNIEVNLMSIKDQSFVDNTRQTVAGYEKKLSQFVFPESVNWNFTGAPTKLLTGQSSVEFYQEIIRRNFNQLKSSRPNLNLSLTTIQFAESPDIQLYSKALRRILEKNGIVHNHVNFSSKLKDQNYLLNELMRIYQDPNVTGVLIYSPLPPNIEWAPLIFSNLPLDKDVEGRTFIKRNPFGVFSPTAKAVRALLHSLEIGAEKFSLSGKHAVMVGHSDLVGKPTATLLSDAGATVTICHKDTRNLEEQIISADILVVAIGKPQYVKGSWIKQGAVVIDVGENFVNGKVIGDVDFDSAIKRASYISPVPGGVGPLTNLMVIENILMLEKYKGSNGNH